MKFGGAVVPPGKRHRRKVTPSPLVAEVLEGSYRQRAREAIAARKRKAAR